MIRLFSSPTSFIWSYNDDGLAVRFQHAKDFEKAVSRRGDGRAQEGYRRMQMLAECGEANVEEVDGGIFVRTEDAVRLDDNTRELFELPAAWPGGMRLTTESVPQLQDFRARLALMDPVLQRVTRWKLKGPMLQVGSEEYLLTPAQYAALLAYEQWRSESVKSEALNLSLLCSLSEARAQGCRIDLEAYGSDGVQLARSQEIVVASTEDPHTGDLLLCPLPQGSFADISLEEMQERLAQLQGNEAKQVVRVGKRIVLMDEVQTLQARAVVARRRVPKAERENFERDSASWLSDHVFPDVPIEFSPRVIGIGELKVGYLGAGIGESEDWFGKMPSMEKPEKGGESDKSDKSSAQREESEEEIEAEEKEKPLVLHPLIIPNDTELGYGWEFPAALNSDAEPFKLEVERYPRKPLDHQKEAIHWLLGHAKRSLTSPDAPSSGGTCAFGAGALLADDMGLGKTFTTLMAIGEWMRHWRTSSGTEPPAVLIVAPLSLVQNWSDEIGKAFGDHCPFSRVVLAQPDMDLKRFLREPGAKDVAVPGQVTAFGLGFGDGSEHSLDMPGSCVITTYQTVRDYRFSFAAAEWSCAVFDEAQHIKNPNAQQTVAAKSLRARFRLSMTGTPVENHLGDFWCILDAAEPGPLGSYAEFREKWILPIQRDRSKMDEVGKGLREFVGGLMLRRTKEECLENLPAKTIVPVLCAMTPEQQALYEQARGNVAEATSESQGAQLAALWHLRQISLHPDLLAGGALRVPQKARECRAELARSGKLAWMLEKLDAIQASGEKVLIFCILKSLQEKLAQHLELIYGVRVPVINGDTKSSSKGRSDNTRLGLIDEFSRADGFGICILSPIAAGAGLNIVAANHVIHLERHWNPAKEDQATDRIYRIGQTKPVTVHLPLAQHPDFASFDVILNGLLEKKRGLQGALGLIPPEAVSGPELMTEVFGRSTLPKLDRVDPITLEQALQLSWKLFEALIAILYQREAERVILTPQASDHGADVVVLGWGPNKLNLLIECKSSQRDTYDAATGPRQIASAVPFYEQPLNVKFDGKRLHSTCKTFSKKTKHAAELCQVELLGRNWLEKSLQQHRPTMAEILAREGSRESVR